MAYGISGPHIDGFREGWAIPVSFSSRHHCKPHYYKRVQLTNKYVSLCGVEVDQDRYHPGARKVFAPGVFMVDRCKHCIRYRQRVM